MPYRIDEQLANADCTNMFGCFEMDKIAECICQALEGFPCDAPLFYDDYLKDSYALFMLAVNGWIEECETSGEFRMREEFFDKIKSLLDIQKERRHLAIS